jgi:hypothetical protein
LNARVRTYKTASDAAVIASAIERVTISQVKAAALLPRVSHGVCGRDIRGGRGTQFRAWIEIESWKV